MGRRIAIWVFGTLASGIFGALIGNLITPYGDGGFFGFFGGAFAFACARLWLGERAFKNSN